MPPRNLLFECLPLTVLSIDGSGLSDSARKLLGLLPDKLASPASPPRRHFRPLYELGSKTLGTLAELGALAELLAVTTRGAALALTARARMRAQFKQDPVPGQAHRRNSGPSERRSERDPVFRQKPGAIELTHVERISGQLLDRRPVARHVGGPRVRPRCA